MKTEKREAGSRRMGASLILSLLGIAGMGITSALGYDATIQGAIFLVALTPAAWLYLSATADTVAAERQRSRQ